MKRTEHTYYLVYAMYCASWSFLTPVYTLFLLHRGLDLFEVNVVFAVYLITAFVFEVPTGAVADVFGRKASFVLSCVLRSVAFGLYWFAERLPDFLIAELVDAIGTTLATGALDAWAVDGMRAEGHAGTTEKLFARAFVYCRPLMVSAGVLGAYAANADIGTPWVLGASGFALTGLVGLLLMREDRKPPGRPHGVLAAWVTTTRDGFVTVRRNPQLAVLCFLTAATAFAVMPAWHYWPARLTDLSGSGIWLVGWMYALISAASMAASAVTPRLVAHFRREHILLVACLIRGGMLMIAALSSTLAPALAGIVVMDAVFGLSEPMMQSWMNERVESAQRATVLSVRSMAFTLGGGLGLICLGLLARQSSIALAWGVSATLLILVAPAFLLLARPVPVADKEDPQPAAIPLG